MLLYEPQKPARLLFRMIYWKGTFWLSRTNYWKGTFLVPMSAGDGGILLLGIDRSMGAQSINLSLPLPLQRSGLAAPACQMPKSSTGLSYRRVASIISSPLSWNTFGIVTRPRCRTPAPRCSASQYSGAHWRTPSQPF
jgi:hypothetical protein